MFDTSNSMNISFFTTALLVIALIISGCVQPPANNPIAGNNKDEYGCIPSAGYQWCETKQKCLRSSEESCPKGTACKTGQRNADACVQVYEPVCGWFDTAKVQCVRAPCAEEYNNSCLACANSEVLYWSEGNCPDPLKEAAKEFCNQEGTAAVYRCGDYIKVISSQVGAPTKAYKINADSSLGKVISCPVLPPEQMSAECRSIVLGQSCEEKSLC